MHLEKALSIIKTILSVDPRCAGAFRLLGIIAQLTGRGEDAIQALDRAIEIDPGDALAYSYRCLIETSHDGINSEADCREALRLRDDLPEAHVGLSLSFALRGRTAEAYKEARRAIALDPESVASSSLLSELARASMGGVASENDLIRPLSIPPGSTK
jgi:tetratricopeptide (TPR) repeat protein